MKFDIKYSYNFDILVSFDLDLTQEIMMEEKKITEKKTSKRNMKRT
jgi:hypothetical protein